MSFLNKTISGAFYLLSLQLLSRIVSFIVNVFIIRSASLELLGFLQDLDLLSQTILFFSREIFRMALIRIPSSAQLAVNSSFFAPIAFLCFSPAYLYFAPSAIPFHVTLIYLAAGAIEILSEPLYGFCQFYLLYSLRVKVEGTALIMSTISTLIGSIILRDSDGHVSLANGLFVHAASQLLLSVVLLAGYAERIRQYLLLHPDQRVHFFPVPVVIKEKRIYVDPRMMPIAISFVFQTFIKHVLTLGDKLALLTFRIQSEQKGAYRLVSDLGSLVCRILFLPLEETSRSFFSKTLANEEVNEADFRIAFNFLETLLQFHIAFGACFVFFASNYTGLLLKYIFGKKSSEAASLLSFYCCYIPFLGINGITEAFVQGVAKPDVLARQSLYMLLFWVIFVAVSYTSVVWMDSGLSGIIVANIINMLLRSLFSYKFIKTFFISSIDSKRFHIHFAQFIPGKITLWAMFAMSWVLTYHTAALDPFTHLFVGITAFIVTASLFIVQERSLLLSKMQSYYRMVQTG